MTTDVAVNEGAAGGDRIQEFHAGSFFDTKIPAVHFTNDFTVAADDQVTGAIDRAGEFTKDG